MRTPWITGHGAPGEPVRIDMVSLAHLAARMPEEPVRICAWCGAELEAGHAERAEAGAPITHGICPNCSEGLK